MSEARVMVPKGPRARQLDWTTRPTDPPLPSWLQLRDSQLDAVDAVVKEYERGARVVFLDAPTGAGKTAVAELVRRRLGVSRGLYVCTTKSLQDQVARDFPYARVLKGRQNYSPTKVGWREGMARDSLTVTCGDCDRAGGDALEDQTCSYCFAVDECPYQVARSEASRAPVGVLNTSYLLTEANGRGNFAGRELVVADECDLIEDELLGYVELRVGARVLERVGLEVPKKGSHMTTIRAWLQEEVEPGLVKLREGIRPKTLEQRRDYRRVNQLVADVRRVIAREEGWVRDGDEEGERGGSALVLKPVSIEDVGDKYLWRHGDQWLAMSGTVVSAETLAESLGLEEAGIEWATVEMPMRFDKANRRVKYIPVQSMTKASQEAEGIDKMLDAVGVIVAQHAGENILIHTHTYKLAREVVAYLSSLDLGVTVATYQEGRDREDALAKFKAMARNGGGVMVAPSMDRGIDLPGELCRCQVIVKVPMASLGSRQVSERMRTPGGDAWYTAATVRNLMQMTGRAVRGEDDWAVCYILDSHFGAMLKKGKRYGMFPQWWLDGLEVGRLGR